MSDIRLFDKIRHPQKRALLLSYSVCLRLTDAIASAKIHRSLHYYWLKVDADYAEAFAEAQRMGAASLEEEAIRRARDGVTRKIFYKDEHIADEQVYSDVLLIFLLKGAMPDKYRDRVDIRVNIQHAAAKVAADLGMTPDEVLAEAQALLHELDHGATAS